MTLVIFCVNFEYLLLQMAFISDSMVLSQPTLVPLQLPPREDENERKSDRGKNSHTRETFNQIEPERADAALAADGPH